MTDSLSHDLCRQSKNIAQINSWRIQTHFAFTNQNFALTWCVLSPAEMLSVAVTSLYCSLFLYSVDTTIMLNGLIYMYVLLYDLNIWLVNYDMKRPWMKMSWWSSSYDESLIWNLLTFHPSDFIQFGTRNETWKLMSCRYQVMSKVILFGFSVLNAIHEVLISALDLDLGFWHINTIRVDNLLIICYSH